MVYTPKGRDSSVKKDQSNMSKGGGDSKDSKSDKNQKNSGSKPDDSRREPSRAASAVSAGHFQASTAAANKDERKFTGRCRLFVGNLTPDTTEDQFKKMFEPYGELSEVYVNSSRGFGFIRLDYRHNAEAAKAALDGMQLKGRVLRVRFATHGAALKVRNLNPHISNELLEKAFSQFGDVERAIVIVDDRGKPTGEGIIEFVRKPGAQQALRRVTEGVFLLGSSPKPISVEPLEQKDEDDGLSEKFINKNDLYKKEREKDPRFAVPGSFEYEFGQRWKQIDEMEKERHKRVDKEMEEARLKLEDEMQNALYDYQAEQIRQDLMRQQEELRRIEEMRAQEQMRRRQEMEMRRQEEERIRAEEERRLMMRQQEMNRRSHMDPGPRGREDMMSGGMRDGPGPRGRGSAPPLPPPPAPPAGMGLDRGGSSNQMGNAMGSGFGNSGNMSNTSGMGAGMANRNMAANNNGMGAMGGSSMRQSRFDQPSSGNFESGFGNQGGMGSGPNSMGSGMGGPGGPGTMFSNTGGMGGQGMRGDRGMMDRRREGGPRDDFGDMKRMRRY